MIDKEDNDGLPFDSIDLEIVSCILKDIYEDLYEVKDLLVDLKSKLPEEQKTQLDTIIEYIMIAGGAVDKAHLDVTDVNFMKFGDKGFRWEPLEKR